MILAIRHVPNTTSFTTKDKGLILSAAFSAIFSGSRAEGLRHAKEARHDLHPGYCAAD
jgi:hypothetical protein